jgi:hypothetical protein
VRIDGTGVEMRDRLTGSNGMMDGRSQRSGYLEECGQQHWRREFEVNFVVTISELLRNGISPCCVGLIGCQGGSELNQ